MRCDINVCAIAVPGTSPVPAVCRQQSRGSKAYTGFVVGVLRQSAGDVPGASMAISLSWALASAFHVAPNLMR